MRKVASPTNVRNVAFGTWPTTLEEETLTVRNLGDSGLHGGNEVPIILAEDVIDVSSCDFQ
jgi:hypothetical protein